MLQLLKATFETGSRASKDPSIESHQKATLGRGSYFTGLEGDVRHRQSFVTASESNAGYRESCIEGFRPSFASESEVRLRQLLAEGFVRPLCPKTSSVL